jgi:membrane protein
MLGLGSGQVRIERGIASAYAWLARDRLTRYPWAVIQTYSRAQGALLSGSMAYYTFLSLLPMLMLAGFVLGTIASSNQHLQDLFTTAIKQLLPGMQARDLVSQLISARTAFGVFGLLSVAYASSGFVGAMTACMNRMWRVEAGRNPIGQKVLNVLMVMLLGVVLLSSVGITVWASYLAKTVLGSDAGPVAGILEWLASPVSMLVVLLLLYRLLPSRQLSWSGQLPGAAFGALGFQALKWGFGVWARRSAGVESLPRSLVSVVLLLVWLGFFGQLLLYGAAVNVVFDRQRRHQPLFPDPFPNSEESNSVPKVVDVHGQTSDPEGRKAR